VNAGCSTRRPGCVGAIAVALVLAAGCRVAPDAIQVERGRVSILNQTDEDWVDVEVRVNRYYLARAPRLQAGGRLDAPINRFQGGFGRYLDPRRERIQRVDVTARTSAGSPVTLTWQADEPQAPSPAPQGRP
jgi:hypothetical protein